MYTQTGAADLTEPYWTVSGFYNGRARSEHLELGCTVLGTESIFFTRSPISPPPPSPPPPSPPSLPQSGDGDGGGSGEIEAWLIALITVGTVLLLALCTLVTLMAAREKAGRPMFTTLDAAVDGAAKGPAVAVTTRA